MVISHLIFFYLWSDRKQNLYAEVTFTCPAQWLAEGFSINGHQSFKYQYSIISALHGDDLFAYFNYTGSLPNNMAQTYRDSVVCKETLNSQNQAHG
jgi:carboxylesterase type B